MSTEAIKPSVSIRPVRSDDTRWVREITFEMLTLAPHAYGESIEEARARSDEDWSAYVDSLSQATERIAFLAFDPDGVCGFVYADLKMPEAPPGMGVIGQLWVAPRQRGTGLGRALMDAAAGWVEKQGAEGIGLGITETNTQVIPFYEHLGYRDTGLRITLEGDPVRQIMVMGRRFRDGANSVSN